MASIRYTGRAPLAAQVDSITPANVEIGDIFTLTVTALDGTTAAISFTAAAATVADVTAGLAAAWNASTNALFSVVTASDETTYLKLTADTAGVAFSVAATETDGGGTDDQTLIRAAVTANSGPSDWSAAANWSGGAVPGASAEDAVYIEDSSTSLLYGLDQSGIANALASLNIAASFTGVIGTAGAVGYGGSYLKIKTAILSVGEAVSLGAAAGSVRLRIDLGATACQVRVANTGMATSATAAALQLLAASASTDIEILRGRVSIAAGSGETATIGDLNLSQGADAAAVFVGAGVTMTNLTQTAGAASLSCGLTAAVVMGGTLATIGSGAATTVTVSGGTVDWQASGAVGTLSVHGGSCYASGSGTITAANALGGVLDFTRSAVLRTVTTLKIDPPAVLKYAPDVVTLTNKLQPYTTSGRLALTASAA